MAIMEPPRPVPFGAISILRTVQFFQDLREGFGVWNNRRTTRKELSRLSDRELEDIGICRGDIDTIVRRMS